MADIVSPMRAQEAHTNRLKKLCENPEWAGERKYDGQRMVAHVDGGKTIHFRSSTGRIQNLAKIEHKKEFGHFLNAQGVDWVLDGEILGGVFYVFDLVKAGSLVTPAMEFVDRRLYLEHCFDQWGPNDKFVQLVPSVVDAVSKAMLAKHILEQRGEGLMFKRLTGKYQPGARSADWLKCKFRKDIDCVVKAVGKGGRNNMVLALYRPGFTEPQEVGDCTALAGDGAKVKVGDVVCVRYLYCSNDDRLVQPTLPRLRDDKLPEDCTWDQLVYVNKMVEDPPQ